MATSTEAADFIEPEDVRIADLDSAYGDDESYSTSIASSVFNYRYAHGRRYHSERENDYILPNDEREQERLDLAHHLHRLILDGKLYKAPIENPQHVLDLGTGTGIWAIDFADEHPSSRVIGNDISPIQPTWVPPNLQFYVDDFEKPWTYPNKFDLVHARTLGGSIEDVPKFLRLIYDGLEPGGYLEFQEFRAAYLTDDNSFPKPSAIEEWVDNVNAAASTFGKVINIAPDLKRYVTEAGFINVDETIYKVPTSPWAKDEKLKEIGRFSQLVSLEALQAYTLVLFTNVLGWTREKVETTLIEVRKEFQNPNIHVYSNLYVVIAQKPKERSS